MASNPYVNKVQKADGTTIIDISDTTAEAADVASGKTLYGADGAPVTGTASESVVGLREGRPIEIPDGTEGTDVIYFLSDIAAAQAGSGDPSPSNIRAISGWDGAEVTRTGANLFGGARFFNRVKTTIPTSTTVDADDHVVRFGSSAEMSGRFASMDIVPFKPGTRYTFIMRGWSSSSSGYSNLAVFYTDGTYEHVPAFGNGSASTTTTVVLVSSASKSVLAFGRYGRGGSSTIYCDECAVLEGVHTVSDFAAYTGETVTVTWPGVGTVYGGTLEAVSGELTVTHGFIASYAGETLPGAWISDRDVYAPNTSPTTGAQVVYELASPSSYGVTPVGIGLEDGINHLWTNAMQSGRCLYLTEAGQDYGDVVSPEPVLVSKSITENGTYDPADDDADGYSAVTVDVPGGTYQAKTGIVPTTSSQTITPDAGYDALSSVQIDAMPSGTAGTPTAAKGAVSNHAVTITPSVTNTAGYIAGGTLTGTGVSVSASELVSGNLPITANGTGIDVSTFSTVSVSVAGKNVQIYSGIGRAISTSYVNTNVSLTVAKAGTYDIYWVGYRNSTGGTNGSQLYVNGSAHSSGVQTTFDATYTNWQSVHLSNVTLAEDDVVAVWARSRSTSYSMYAANLVIIEA